MTKPTSPNSAAALKKLTIARAQLLLNKGHGFFGMLALRLALVERPDIKTLAVDGKHCFYNADFVVNELTDSLARSAMAHEVMHCVFEHITRRSNRTPRKWNQAGDFVINLVLEDANFDIGPGWLLNRAYADMTTDEVYNLLPDSDDEGGGDSSGAGGGDSGDPLDEVLQGDPAEHEHTDIDWKLATVQAAATAKAQGQLPASLKRFVEEITAPPKVNWRDQLRQFITQISKDDYSWSRPNRRYLSAGIYLPGLWSENMGEIVVCIDTSGSIDQATLNAFGSEIKALVAAVRPTKTHVIYCDADINHIDVYDPHDDMQFKMHGGGGTDFRPPFDYVKEQGLQPECLVYLTDLYGPQPSSADFPVLWCCTSGQIGQIGETIQIEV